jgi:hypothetical protein
VIVPKDRSIANFFFNRSLRPVPAITSASVNSGLFTRDLPSLAAYDDIEEESPMTANLLSLLQQTTGASSSESGVWLLPGVSAGGACIIMVCC